jgi:hypothetical protein
MHDAQIALIFGVGTSLCTLASTAIHLSSLPKKLAIVTGCAAFVSIYAMLFIEKAIQSFIQKNYEAPIFFGASCITGSLLTTCCSKLFINPNISLISSACLFSGSLLASTSFLWIYENLV